MLNSLLIILTLGVIVPQQVQAAPVLCADANETRALLGNKYKEKLFFKLETVYHNDRVPVEIWANETEGTYSILIIPSPEIACAALVGDHWPKAT